MTDDPREELDRVLAAAKESRLVIFVGAGVSMGAPTNLPSWDDINRIVVQSLARIASAAIGEQLANSASDIVLGRHAQRKLPPMYQAEVLAEFLHDRYYDVLRFIDSDQPNASHLAIAWLAKLGCVRAIFTTNFDRVVEKAFAAVGAPLETLYEPNHFRALAANLDRLDRPGAPCRLFKLHGSVDDPKTLIDTLAQRRRGFELPVLLCARRLLDIGHWVFLGWSSADLEAEPNYLSLRQRADSARGFTWLVRANTKPSEAVARLKDLYGDRGAVIAGELPNWLLDFSSLISPDPAKWIAEYLAYGRKPSTVTPKFALDDGARRWARDLSSIPAAMALGFLVMACAEPQAAVTLVETLIEAIEARWPDTAPRAKGELLMQAVATNALGVLLQGLGRHDEAIIRLTKAVKLASKAGDDDMRDRFRGNLAWSLEAYGRVDEARAMYESALAGYRGLGDPVPVAFGLTMLASHFIRQMRLDDAERCASEAVHWAKRAGDEKLRGTALNDLGLIAKLRGNYSDALANFEEVERLFSWLGNDDAAAAAAGNRGEVLAALGRFNEAEAVQRSVLEIEQRIGRLDNQGATCLSLGTLNQLRGNAGEAERWFVAARDVFQGIGDPSNEALALFRLATLKNDLGQFEEAADLADTGVSLTSGKDDALTTDLWFQLGRASLSLGFINRAEEAFREAIVLGERVGATRVVASATQNLGTALLLVQRDGEAAAAFADARDLWRALNDDDAVAYCALCESAVDLDARISALSSEGHAATEWSERQSAAREMFGLYPDLIAMYEQVGALQLVAGFCVAAASSAQFISEDTYAIDWLMRGGSLYRDIGASDRAGDAFARAERLLQDHVNALLQRALMEDAMPLLLQLAEVSGQLGHTESQATAMYNAAIGSIRGSADFDRASALASQAADLFDPDSNEAERARRLVAFCAAEQQRAASGGDVEGTVEA